jgi:hypothetical protein
MRINTDDECFYPQRNRDHGCGQFAGTICKRNKGGKTKEIDQDQ